MMFSFTKLISISFVGIFSISTAKLKKKKEKEQKLKTNIDFMVNLE